MMTWVVGILVVLVLGAVAAVAAGRAGTWQEPERDRVALPLPDDDLGAEDLRRVRFPLALRGYRMKDVDALLDRLADQLDGADGQRADSAPAGRSAREVEGDTT